MINHQKAYEIIKEAGLSNFELSESFIKDIHGILMENIISGGFYRNINVRIRGASFSPIDWTGVGFQMENLIYVYTKKIQSFDPIYLASFVHAEFVKIHPFIDGNGRLARLLVNFILIKNKYRALKIRAVDRPRYFNLLDLYAREGNLDDFYKFILEKEYQVLKLYEEEIDKAFDKNL
ncbi:MAG: Fic family protein [Anaerococcus sp.]|nr:Fic family protein [Anaerococcus sp.]